MTKPPLPDWARIEIAYERLMRAARKQKRAKERAESLERMRALRARNKRERLKRGKRVKKKRYGFQWVEQAVVNLTKGNPTV